MIRGREGGREREREAKFCYQAYTPHTDTVSDKREREREREREATFCYQAYTPHAASVSDNVFLLRVLISRTSADK